jgi:hypothetical protein
VGGRLSPRTTAYVSDKQHGETGHSGSF